jgi:hypothetical protein
VGHVTSGVAPLLSVRTNSELHKKQRQGWLLQSQYTFHSNTNLEGVRTPILLIRTPTESLGSIPKVTWQVTDEDLNLGQWVGTLYTSSLVSLAKIQVSPAQGLAVTSA